MSLLFSCGDDNSIENFDIMADKPVQCFTGTRSLFKNLELIPEDYLKLFNPLKLSDKDYILKDLDGIISRTHQEKAFKMIYERCKYCQ